MSLLNPGVLAAAAVAIVVVILIMWSKLDLHAAADRNRKRERAAYTEGGFIAHFAESNIDAAVASAVYRSLENTLLVKHIPVFPSDDLWEVHHIDNEDLNDLLEDLARELGRGFRRTDRRWQGQRPLMTVADVVRFVDALPRTSARAEEAS